MKLLSIEVKNIGKIVHEVVHINKALNLFYGEVEAGKTTLVFYPFKLIIEGNIPRGVLRKGESDGFVEVVFDEVKIRREFYTNREGNVAARTVEYIVDKDKLDRPKERVLALINPFLQDQNFLINKSALERERFFVTHFGIDTAALDKIVKDEKAEASRCRMKVASYGDIDITPVPKSNLSAIEKEKEDAEKANDKIRKDYGIAKQAQTDQEDKNRELKRDRDSKNDKINIIKEALETYQAKIIKGKAMLVDEKQNLVKLPKPTKIKPVPDPKYDNVDDINERYFKAREDSQDYKQYETRLKDHKEKEEYKSSQRKHETVQRKAEEDKRKMLSTISKKSGVKGLTFDENGKFSFEDATADMLSQSQLMRLSSEIQSTYPTGLKLEIIDGGESLGKSIFKYIDKAKREKTTILATIVGEKPANVPPEIGVFVVEDGKVTSK